MTKRRGSSAIGYRNPPRETRFKPGQSGNPRGRPKGSKNLATEIRKALSQRIVVTDRGRQRSIPKRQALAMQLINKAMQDPKLLGVLLRAVGPLEDEASETDRPSAAFRQEDALVMESIVRRIRQMDEAPSAAATPGQAPEQPPVPIETPN